MSDVKPSIGGTTKKSTSFSLLQAGGQLAYGSFYEEINKDS